MRLTQVHGCDSGRRGYDLVRQTDMFAHCIQIASQGHGLVIIKSRLAYHPALLTLSKSRCSVGSVAAVMLQLRRIANCINVEI